MKTQIGTMLVVAAMAALTGCATTVYRVSETTLPEDAVAPAAVTPGVSPATVTVTPGTGAQGLTAGIASSATSALAANGFVVGSSAAPVAAVAVTTSLRTKDKLENWEVLEAGASVRVTASDGRSLGETSCGAVSKRTYYRAAAEAELAGKLAADVSKWLRANIRPQKMQAVAYLKEKPLTVSRIRFVAFGDADSDDTLRAQRAFMDWIRSRQGVVYAQIVDPNNLTEFNFKVTYDATLFPNGLANTLVVDWNDRRFKVARGN